MSATKSVMLAIEVTTRAREIASADLARIQLAASSAQDQMNQLEHYAADTASRWSDSASKQITAELMRHHYQFLDRLHHAINLQRSVLESLASQVDEARNALLQVELRLAGLKKIIAKQRLAQTAHENRREQRQMDELAAGQHTKLVRHRQTGGQP